MKPKRIENRALLDEVSGQRCVICQKWPSDPDHVISRGAGGGDTEDNVMPLCREHHTERHKVGRGRMIERYAGYRNWLVKHGREDILEKAARFGK